MTVLFHASTERQSFMYNFFVICGPVSDPAGVKGSATAAEAFKKIADAKQPFCSRGDNSGTHNKEMKIWSAAAPVLKLDPAWYTSLGSGMGDTLTKANEMNAYVLTDKATFLSMKDKLPNLTILVNESDDMKNTYSLLADCGLTELRGKKTSALSGGERQRMCFARMLAGNWPCLLLDEPLSAVDIRTSRSLEDTLVRRCNENGTTLLMSTHLPAQAMAVSTKVLLMDGGRVIEYTDTTDFLHPQSAFGREFIAQWDIRK